MKKSKDFRKVFSNLELEEEGRGIIMGVSRLLLLVPFYTIQTWANILHPSVQPKLELFVVLFDLICIESTTVLKEMRFAQRAS